MEDPCPNLSPLSRHHPSASSSPWQLETSLKEPLAIKLPFQSGIREKYIYIKDDNNNKRRNKKRENTNKSIHIRSPLSRVTQSVQFRINLASSPRC